MLVPLHEKLSSLFVTDVAQIDEITGCDGEGDLKMVTIVKVFLYGV